MTQVNIKRLDSLSHNDTAATKLINDNFEAIEKALEDSLSRVPAVPNYMDTELDMNTRRIINTAEPVEDGDAINKRYFDKRVGDAKLHADEAKAAADRAESHANNAQVANKNTQVRANEVVEVLEEVKDIEADIEVKNLFRPFIVWTQFPVSGWVSDDVNGLSNTYTKELTAVDTSRHNLDKLTAYVSFNKKWAEEGSLSPYAEVLHYINGNDKIEIACTIYKTGSIPSEDIEANITFMGTEREV